MMQKSIPTLKYTDISHTMGWYLTLLVRLFVTYHNPMNRDFYVFRRPWWIRMQGPAAWLL